MPQSILIVEDDPTVSGALATLLSLEGFRVTTGYDAESALEQIGNRPPRVILLDYRLREKDAPAFLLELEQRGLRDNTAVVLMTAYNLPVETIKEMKLDGFLLKPVQFVDLLAEIRRVGRQTEPGS